MEKVNFFDIQNIDCDLLAIVKDNNDSELNYLVTPSEFMSNRDYMEIRGYAVRLDTSQDAYLAVQNIADFLAGMYNTLGRKWSISKEQVSSATKRELRGLLKPILDANRGKDEVRDPLQVVSWVDHHGQYVKNLDAIFVSLGLLCIDRNRHSVTQGTVTVNCCGKEIVTYGDEMWLRCNDNVLTNGSREIYGKQFGPVIGGWGSNKPDFVFRRAALIQYAAQIAELLNSVKELDVQIAESKEKESRLTEPKFMGR